MKTKKKDFGYHVNDANGNVVYRGQVTVEIDDMLEAMLYGYQNDRKDDDQPILIEMFDDAVYPAVLADYLKVNPEFKDNGEMEIMYDIFEDSDETGDYICGGKTAIFPGLLDDIKD